MSPVTVGKAPNFVRKRDNAAECGAAPRDRGAARGCRGSPRCGAEGGGPGPAGGRQGGRRRLGSPGRAGRQVAGAGPERCDCPQLFLVCAGAGAAGGGLRRPGARGAPRPGEREGGKEPPAPRGRGPSRAAVRPGGPGAAAQPAALRIPAAPGRGSSAGRRRRGRRRRGQR